MKGFFKRDLYLLLPSLPFYGFMVVVMGISSILGSTNLRTFLIFYITVLVASAIMGLFGSDEVGCWQAYAAAVPEGRRGQVDGRYALALFLEAVTVALTAPALAVGSGIRIALFCAGMSLLYIDLAIPVGYRFSNRGRLVMVAVTAIMTGSLGAAIPFLSAAQSHGGFDPGAGPGLFLLLAGLLGLPLSRAISLRVMEKKQL